MQITTQIHSEFNHGDHLKAWILDFSLSQLNGLTAAGVPSSKIGGCTVHFFRNGQKMADRVTEDKESNDLFMQLVYQIPKLEK